MPSLVGSEMGIRDRCIEKPFEKIKHYEKMYVGPTKEQEVLKTFCGT